MVQDRWEKNLKHTAYAPLKLAINAGLENVRKWYRKMDDTDAYIIAMALNPVVKLVYIKLAWDAKYVELANEIFEKKVRYQCRSESIFSFSQARFTVRSLRFYGTHSD
jgi:hypothetical protein